MKKGWRHYVRREIGFMNLALVSLVLFFLMFWSSIGCKLGTYPLWTMYSAEKVSFWNWQRNFFNKHVFSAYCRGCWVLGDKKMSQTLVIIKMVGFNTNLLMLFYFRHKKKEPQDGQFFYFDSLSDSLRNLFSCAKFHG